jgi:hypothetical protein
LEYVIMLERACAALASLVRAEYGEHHALSYVAATWGEVISAEQVEALRALESGSFAEVSDELADNSLKGPDVNTSQIDD